MDDHSWMYQNSPEELYRQDYLYLRGLRVLLIWYFLIQRILVEKKLYVHMWNVKNKKHFHKDAVMIHLLEKKIYR
jgi:hypothetical protein